MSRNETFTRNQGADMMTTTRPNLRLVDLIDTTSPQTRRRVRWDIAAGWALAVIITGISWATLFIVMTR